MHPRLWHSSRRGIAVGVSLGVFFGLQIPFAAGSALLLRANVPVAVGATLITSPVTFAPLYLVAHHMGSAILGSEDALPAAVVSEPPNYSETFGWWNSLRIRIVSLGKPLLLGLAILAFISGICTYAFIILVWRLRTTWIWKRRRQKNQRRDLTRSIDNITHKTASC